jgi:hypothetical protein
MLSRILLLPALMSPAVVHGADQAFAQNNLTGSKQVVTFPVGNPGAMTVVGPQSDTLVGLDFDPEARVLWALDFTTQTLGTVDQASGAYSPNVALQGGCCITSFTVDPVRGTFYVSKGDDKIHELDRTTGATTLLALGAAAGSQISALAMDCTGQLIAADGTQGSGNLYRVNLAGNPTLIGFPGISGATSMEFDNRTGALYGWFNPAGADSSTHATIDPSTAALSATSQLSGRYRMAIRNTCPVEALRIFSDGYES